MSEALDRKSKETEPWWKKRKKKPDQGTGPLDTDRYVPTERKGRKKAGSTRERQTKLTEFFDGEESSEDEELPSEDEDTSETDDQQEEQSNDAAHDEHIDTDEEGHLQDYDESDITWDDYETEAVLDYSDSDVDCSDYEYDVEWDY